MTPDDIVNALTQGNSISPSGNLPLDGKYPFVPVNTVVRNVHDLATIPLRTGPEQPVYIEDVGYVQDSTDFPTGYCHQAKRTSAWRGAGSAGLAGAAVNGRWGQPDDQGLPALLQHKDLRQIDGKASSNPSSGVD